MYFTFGPERLHMEAIVHSEWEKGKAASGASPEIRLWVCFSRKQTQELLGTKDLKHPEELSQLGDVLPLSSKEQLLEMSGDAASTLGAMLVATVNEGVIVGMKSYPELAGFWAPPPSGPRSNGILIWSDEDKNFHLAVVQSKDQAATIIRGFEWMDSPRRTGLLDSISGWNCRPNSKVEPLRVDGMAAELFSRASIWGKMKHFQRRSAN